MERDDRFKFKLSVPQWVNDGQVSGVPLTPQKINCGDFMDTFKHGLTKISNKELRMSSYSTNKPTAAKQIAQELPEMAALPLIEKHEKIVQRDCSPAMLCPKLLDEVEKLKRWNIKVNSEAVQRDKQLQENKKTIESQRKAIQDLKIGNERLNIKLDEQISENKDLSSKCTTTRNLFNTLKESIERSSKRMDSFQSERQKTQDHLNEYNENIQTFVAEYEKLRAQAEADQQILQKVKEDLQQFEDLKNKQQQEYTIKEKEAAELRTELKDKENELQTILLNLHESQKNCEDLRQKIDFQNEFLQSSKTSQENLLQELQMAEQRSKETLERHAATKAMLDQSKEEYAEIIRSKDLNLEELIKFNNQQEEKLQQLQTTINELQDSLNSEIQRAKELEEKLVAENVELQKRNTILEESIKQSNGQIKIIKEELDGKSKSIESMKGKINATEGRMENLEDELSRKTGEAKLLQCKVQELEGLMAAENKKNEELISQMEQLQKDISQHETKQGELLSNLHELQSEKTAIEQQLKTEDCLVKATEADLKMSKEKVETLTKKMERMEVENVCLREEVNVIKTKSQAESENLEKKAEEDQERLQAQIKGKEKVIRTLEKKVKNLNEDNKNLQKRNEEYSLHTEELKNQIQKLKSTVADTELKCQNKVSDMVTLMEKHKSQYDRIVGEKDAELDENRKKEKEAADHNMFLECELNKQKERNNHLEQQLKTEMTEKGNVQKELSGLQKEMASLKVTLHSKLVDKESPASHCKQKKRDPITKENFSVRRVMGLPDTRKTPTMPSNSKGRVAAVKKEMRNEDKKTHQVNRSYTINTPPETLVAQRKKSIIEPGSSDDSELNDTLGYGSATAPKFSASSEKLNTFPKVSSHPCPNPSSSLLRQTALKRIRTAGWAGLPGPDSKRKMCFEKIFE